MRKVITGSLALSVAVASIVAASPAHSSAIGFERTHNTMLQFSDPDSFAEALVTDAPPPPAHQAEIVAANRQGEALTTA